MSHSRPPSRPSGSIVARLACTLALLSVEPVLAQSGTLDPTFGIGGKNQIFFDNGGADADLANDVAVQPDGKIVMIGRVESASGGMDFGITRLQRNGLPDFTFGTLGRVIVAFDQGQTHHDIATAVALQPDGKILVGGYVATSVANNFDIAVVRLLPDGTLDSSFSGDGKVTVPLALGGNGFDSASDLTLQSDGKILVAGQFEIDSRKVCGLTRLTASGALDVTFAQNGYTVVGFTANVDSDCRAVAVQPDGKILAAASVEQAGVAYDTGVVRLSPGGIFDVTFDGDGVAILDVGGHAGDFEQVKDMELLADGRIVLAGQAYPVSSPSEEDFTVARLLPSGALDTSFSGDGKVMVPVGGSRDLAAGLVVRPSGEIVVAGTSFRTGADEDFSVIQLLPDGSLDGTFGGGGRAFVFFDLGQSNQDDLKGIALRPSGELVLAGGVQRVLAGDWDFGVAQLLGDPQIFADGFESGNLSAWSLVVP